MSADRDVHVTLIRHAPTRGNLEGRYIGATDEGLGDQGRELARKAQGAYARLKPQFRGVRGQGVRRAFWGCALSGLGGRGLHDRMPTGRRPGGFRRPGAGGI